MKKHTKIQGDVSILLDLSRTTNEYLKVGDYVSIDPNVYVEKLVALYPKLERIITRTKHNIIGFVSKQYLNSSNETINVIRVLRVVERYLKDYDSVVELGADEKINYVGLTMEFKDTDETISHVNPEFLYSNEVTVKFKSESAKLDLLEMCINSSAHNTFEFIIKSTLVDPKEHLVNFRDCPEFLMANLMSNINKVTLSKKDETELGVKQGVFEDPILGNEKVVIVDKPTPTLKPKIVNKKLDMTNNPMKRSVKLKSSNHCLITYKSGEIAKVGELTITKFHPKKGIERSVTVNYEKKYRDSMPDEVISHKLLEFFAENYDKDFVLYGNNCKFVLDMISKYWTGIDATVPWNENNIIDMSFIESLSPKTFADNYCTEVSSKKEAKRFVKIISKVYKKILWK